MTRIEFWPQPDEVFIEILFAKIKKKSVECFWHFERILIRNVNGLVLTVLSVQKSTPFHQKSDLELKLILRGAVHHLEMVRPGKGKLKTWK